MMEYTRMYNTLYAVVCVSFPATRLITMVKVLTRLGQTCIVFVTIGEDKLTCHRTVVKTPKTLEDMP
jgi:hypothetical protein